MDGDPDDEVLELMVRELGPSPSREQIEAFVDRLDANKDGRIDTQELGMKMRLDRLETEKRWLNAAICIQKVQRGRAARERVQKEHHWPSAMPVGDTRAVHVLQAIPAQPMSVEQLLVDAQWVWEMLLAEAVHEEAGDVLREKLHNEIQQYRHPGDGLSLEEHIWLDIAVPVLKQLLHPLLKEVVFEGAQDYVMEMRATRVLTELLGATVNPLALDVAKEVLEEARVQAVLSDIVESEVRHACRAVGEEQMGILESSDRLLSSEQDFNAVCEAASQSIVSEGIFRHLMTVLGTQGTLWDFEDFLGGAWCDQLIASVLTRHIEAIDRNITQEPPLFKDMREEVVSHIGIEYFIEQLRLEGKKTPHDQDENDV